MALTLTADPDTLPGGVRLIVTGADLTGLALWRRPAGSTVTSQVRCLILTSGPTRFDGVDYQAPFDTPCEYWATTPTDSSPTVPAVTVPSGGHDWLRSIGMPALSRPIQIESFDEYDRNLAAEQVRPLGSAYPVAVIDARVGATATLTLITDTDGQAAHMRVFLADSPLALLGGPPAHGWGVEGMYVLLAGYKEARIPGATAYEPTRRWSIDVIETGPPDVTIGLAGTWTWRDHIDAGHTWADWSAMTWMEVLFGRDGQLPPSALRRRRAPMGVPL